MGDATKGKGDEATMSVTTGITLTENGVRELSELLGEPTWLREKRLAAWRAYCDLALPRWDRTDLAGLNLGELVVHDGERRALSADELPASVGRAAAGRDGDGEAVVVQVNSGGVWARVPESLQSRGVIVCDFPTAVQKHEEILRRHYMSAVPFDEDKLVALHYAAASSGFLVYVPRNTAVEVPVELRIDAGRAGLGLFPHILVVAEQGAEVTILEVVRSEDGAEQRVVSQVVEICPQDGAQVRYGAIQSWGDATYNFTARRALLRRDARVEWMGGDFGSRLSRSHVRSILEGTGSESTNLSVFYGARNQHLDLGITMRHVGDHTASDMVTKGVLDGRARVVYRGLTDIENGARFTSAFQRENTMLLSEEARSDAIPGLEIDETEVQAGHAATVGQIDKVHLFYLMSRGLPKQEAIRLIVEGFFDPVLQRMPVERVRREIQALIEGKMKG